MIAFGRTHMMGLSLQLRESWRMTTIATHGYGSMQSRGPIGGSPCPSRPPGCTPLLVSRPGVH